MTNFRLIVQQTKSEIQFFSTLLVSFRFGPFWFCRRPNRQEKFCLLWLPVETNENENWELRRSTTMANTDTWLTKHPPASLKSFPLAILSAATQTDQRSSGCYAKFSLVWQEREKRFEHLIGQRSGQTSRTCHLQRIHHDTWLASSNFYAFLLRELTDPSKFYILTWEEMREKLV